MCLGVLDIFRQMPVEVAFFQICAGQMLARMRVLRVERQSFVGPFDGVVVAPLVPVGHRDLQMHQRGEGVAFQGLELHLQPFLQLAQRLQQLPG